MARTLPFSAFLLTLSTLQLTSTNFLQHLLFRLDYFALNFYIKKLRIHKLYISIKNSFRIITTLKDAY